MTLPVKGMSNSLKNALRNSSAAAMQDLLPDHSRKFPPELLSIFSSVLRCCLTTHVSSYCALLSETSFWQCYFLDKGGKQAQDMRKNSSAHQCRICLITHVSLCGNYFLVLFG